MVVDKSKIEPLSSTIDNRLLIDQVSLFSKLRNELSRDELSYESLQILNKLCTSSSSSIDGYQKTMDLFNTLKSSKNERYRFKSLSNQLERVVNSTTLSDECEKIVFELINLVNNLLIECKSSQDKIRIQYEYIGLKINERFKSLKEIFCKSDQILELINTFDLLLNKDDFSANDGVDLNSHIDIFHSIYSQVLGTPNEYTFLCILRHLLRLESSNKQSEIIWELIEKLVYRATVFNKEENSVYTLERYADNKLISITLNESNQTESLKSHVSKSNSIFTVASPLPPPPAPPLPPSILSFNVSSSKKSIESQISDSLKQTKLSNIGTIKTPNNTQQSSGKLNLNDNINLNGNDSQIEFDSEKLPQQCVPKPHSKMKQLAWSKIHSNRIIGKENLWTRFKQQQNEADSESQILLSDDAEFFNEIEELFKISENPRAETQCKEANLKETKNWNSSEKMNLLDSKRSLNINIYLKQFRCSPSEIVRLLSNNENQELGLENLEGTLKILPDTNEVELLKGYQGEIDKLGEAEKFLIKLIQVPNYKLRIESLLLKEEFNSQMFYFKKSFENIFNACEVIYNSSNLATMFLYICKTGNFINEGGYSGNAAGFKLSSLLKLCDLKSNKTSITLLHLIIQQLEEKNSKIINMLLKEMVILKQVTSIQFESFKSEINTFCNRVKKLSQQVTSVDDSQLNNLKEFIATAFMSINVLEEQDKHIEPWRLKLADHFCEDPSVFKLEECFNILERFLDKIKTILNENKERKSNELRRHSCSLNSRSIHHSDEASFDHLLQFKRNGSIKNQLSGLQNARRSTSSDVSRLKLGDQANNLVNNEITDLDDYTTNNEEKFIFRPSNVRFNRRSLINRHSPHRLANTSCSASNLLIEGQNSTETSQLLNFLNNGLDNSNRELTTTSSLNLMSREAFSGNNKIHQKENEEKNENNSLVKLRRSSSTTDVEAAISLRLNYRRGITSAILKEEDNNCEENNNSKDQENNENNMNGRIKNPHRLTSLKKLGSLYREFDELDDEYFERAKTKKVNTVSSLSPISQSCAHSNIHTKKIESINFALKNPHQTTEATSKFANVSINNTNALLTDLDENYINSKLKYTSELRQNNNLVMDHIMKFENGKSVEANNLIIETVTNNSLIEKNEVINEAILESPSKVKSLSKNWEMMATHNSNITPNITATIHATQAKQINVVTNSAGLKLDRFLLDSTLSSNSNSNFASPNPHNNTLDKLQMNSDFVSSSSSSDNEQSSKDDGFETQSNASVSQKSDTVTIKITETEIIEKKVSDLNEYLININTNNKAKEDEKSTSINLKSTSDQSRESVEEPQLKPKENNSIQSQIKKKQQKQTIVTITTISRKKGTSNQQRPISTSITTSITKKASSKSINREHSINLSIRGNHSCLSKPSAASAHLCGAYACESKRKSGSTSALYLTDTASTKAKKAAATAIAAQLGSQQSINDSNSNISLSSRTKTISNKKSSNQNLIILSSLQSGGLIVNGTCGEAESNRTSLNELCTVKKTKNNHNNNNQHHHHRTRYNPNLNSSVFERLTGK